MPKTPREDRRREQIRALVAADERERLPLPISIDPPGATDDEVRRNFQALQSFSSIDPIVLAILTARFHRRFENPFWQNHLPLPPVPEDAIRRAREEWLTAVARTD